MIARKPLKRGKGLARVGRKKREARAARAARAAAPPPVATMVATSAPAIASSTARARGSARPRLAELRSEALIDALHALPCFACGAQPVTAHHFPPRSVVGVTNDLLAAPVCGDGVAGCHGHCQRREISDELQAAAVGLMIAVHLRAARVTWPAIEEALAAVPRRDVARWMRRAVVAELGRELAS